MNPTTLLRRQAAAYREAAKLITETAVKESQDAAFIIGLAKSTTLEKLAIINDELANELEQKDSR